jgi:hypothetical protein
MDRPGKPGLAPAREHRLSGLEPHGRPFRQPVDGLARARHRTHHRPIDEPMPFPRIPQGDIIPCAPICNSIRDQTTGAY